MPKLKRDDTKLIQECVSRILAEVAEDECGPEGGKTLGMVISDHITDLVRENYAKKDVSVCMVQKCDRQSAIGGLCSMHDEIVHNLEAAVRGISPTMYAKEKGEI